MKTAMTELIESYERSANQYLEMKQINKASLYFRLARWAKEGYFEKEKEQIMNAYEHGYEACDMDEAMEVNKKLTSGDLYYNMNYNQNK